MNLPFEAFLDGQKIEKFFVHANGKSLTAKVLPRSEWSKELRKELTEIEHYHGGNSSIEKFDKPIPLLEEPVFLYLFETPFSEYKDLEEHLNKIEKKRVNMGEFLNLRAYKQSEIEERLKIGFLYDLFAIGIYRGSRRMSGGGRLSTQEGKVPKPMTLDELKLFAIEDLEITIEQAQKIEARIIPLTAWGVHQRFIIAGFELGKTELGSNYGINVQHNGVVSYYGYTKEELRKVILSGVS